MLQVGDRVKGRHLATVRGPKVCKEWFKGVVIAVHSAGDAYDIQYDDGDDEEEVSVPMRLSLAASCVYTVDVPTRKPFPLASADR